MNIHKYIFCGSLSAHFTKCAAKGTVTKCEKIDVEFSKHI